MFDREDLRAAVADEVISAEQAARLERWLVARKAGRADPGAPIDGEKLRFITNLNDIFITIGLAILFSGTAALLATTIGFFFVENPRMGVLTLALPLAAAAWIMSEYFCIRRRMLLPSMFLVLVFVTAIAFAGSALLLSSAPEVAAGLASDVEGTVSRLGYAGLGAAVLAALAFYWRFRLPFSIGVLAVALSSVMYLWAVSQGQFGLLAGGMVSLIAGIGCLLAGVWFDFQDPERVTRDSDTAFWLHLVAAPQIIWGTNLVLRSAGVNVEAPAGAAVLIAVLLGIAFVSVAINRRALVVASITTFAVAVFTVLFGTQGNPVTATALAALIVGGGIVLLGAGWKTARLAVLGLLPRSGIWQRIFPPEIA